MEGGTGSPGDSPVGAGGGVPTWLPGWRGNGVGKGVITYTLNRHKSLGHSAAKTPFTHHDKGPHVPYRRGGFHGFQALEILPLPPSPSTGSPSPSPTLPGAAEEGSEWARLGGGREKGSLAPGRGDAPEGARGRGEGSQLQPPSGPGRPRVEMRASKRSPLAHGKLQIYKFPELN